MNNRNKTIDVLKGIMISAVVIGHIAGTLPPPNYNVVFSLCYSWHMICFMMTVGFVAAKYGHIENGQQKLVLRAKRLLLPCVTFFGTFIDVHRDAVFESKFFSANTGSVIVVGKHISLGHDVMMGRNIVIYDSDFHSIPGSDGNPVNYSKDVTIEDHVWLTNNVTVLKGVTIGKDSLISAMTLIRKDIPEKSLVAGIPGKVLKDNACWSREYIHDYEKQFWE